MPATVSEVATGLKTALSAITGLRTFSYQPEQLNPPMAFPVLNQVNYHGAMGGGLVTMDWTIQVVVGRYVDRVAHTTLDGYLSFSGATSIRAALELDKTLGGKVQNLILSSSANISSLEQDDADFLQISSTLTVYA
jgi:hypothetical protein